MQVSWIDPEEISALARELLDPPPGDPRRPTGFQPLPDAASLASAPLINDSSEQEPFHRAPDHSPELEQIRAKLRHIRDRAKDAGLLPSTPIPAAQVPVAAPTASSFPSPPAEPEPEPEPAPVASPTPEPATPPVLETRVEAPAATAEDQSFQPEPGSIADRLDAFAKWAAARSKSDNLLVLDHHGDILWGVPTREDLVVQTMLLINSATIKGTPVEHALRTNTTADKQITVLRSPTRYGSVTISILASNSPHETILADLRQSLTLAIDEATVN